MKLASLATYFGLGEQSHRSLDDVRMNLEVLKYCATVLFLAVLWNMDTLQTDSTHVEHEYLITYVRFRPNSTQLLTVSYDKFVRLWDAANPSYCLQAYTGHTSHVISLDEIQRRMTCSSFVIVTMKFVTGTSVHFHVLEFVIPK